MTNANKSNVRMVGKLMFPMVGMTLLLSALPVTELRASIPFAYGVLELSLPIQLFSQGELGTIATPYIETGASTAQAGILENTPRFDYSGGATCPSLLLEPSRSNLVTQSEYFGDSYWTKTGSSVIGGFTSPEGLSNAYKLVEGTGTGSHSMYSGVITTVISNTYTTSVYAKAGERDWFFLYGTAGDTAYFDLANGVLGTVVGGVAGIEALANGWYFSISAQFV